MKREGKKEDLSRIQVSEERFCQDMLRVRGSKGLSNRGEEGPRPESDIGILLVIEGVGGVFDTKFVKKLFSLNLSKSGGEHLAKPQDRTGVVKQERNREIVRS